jgi:hypothetical protein
MRNIFFLGKPEGNKSLGRPELKWEDSIKVEFREIGSEGVVGFIWLRIGIGGELL